MPTHEVPAALQDFIKHRQHLKSKESTPAVKKKLGLTDHKSKAELEQGIEGIIERKPNNVSTISVRFEPTKPAMPKISP